MSAPDPRRLMLGRPDWAANPWIVKLRVDRVGYREGLATAGFRPRIAKPFAANRFMARVRLARADMAA
ncbi:MAG: hypothetical protein U1E62_10705 [Alsobacter sp.]